MTSLIHKAAHTLDDVVPSAKVRDLSKYSVDVTSNDGLTTDHGVKISDTDNWFGSEPLLYDVVVNFELTGSRFLMGQKLDRLFWKTRSPEKRYTVLIMSEFQNVSFMLVAPELMVTSRCSIILQLNGQPPES